MTEPTVTLDDRIETVEWDISELQTKVADAGDADNADLWDDLSTELEDAEEHLDTLITERDA